MYRQMINLYHFGMDQDDYWRNLDQYHAPGTIEERFTYHYVGLDVLNGFSVR